MSFFSLLVVYMSLIHLTLLQKLFIAGALVLCLSCISIAVYARVHAFRETLASDQRSSHTGDNLELIDVVLTDSEVETDSETDAESSE